MGENFFAFGSVASEPGLGCSHRRDGRRGLHVDDDRPSGALAAVADVFSRTLFCNGAIRRDQISDSHDLNEKTIALTSGKSTRLVEFDNELYVAKQLDARWFYVNFRLN